MCAQLSSDALEAPGAKDFLVFLGFDFQKDGAYEKDPFVVFPHWDHDGSLAMTSQVLSAVCGKIEITMRCACPGSTSFPGLTAGCYSCRERETLETRLASFQSTIPC